MTPAQEQAYAAAKAILDGAFPSNVMAVSTDDTFGKNTLKRVHFHGTDASCKNLLQLLDRSFVEVAAQARKARGLTQRN